MKGKISLIASGKGGVGKSSICCFLGDALARKGRKVLIIELDCGLRSLDIMLGVSDKIVFDLSDVLSSRCEASKAIIPCDHNPSLFLLPASQNERTDIDLSRLMELCRFLSGFYQDILIDMPAGVGVKLQSLSSIADLVMICVTPDPISIRDGAKVLSVMGEAVRTSRLLINRVPTNIRSLTMVRDLDEVIDIVGAQLLGVIPESREYALCAASGTSLPQTECRAVFDRIAARMTGKHVPLAFH